VERKHVERKFSGICGAESGHNIEHLGVKSQSEHLFKCVVV
jgi:hypothetical protein